MLSVTNSPQWRTVVGGSRIYVDKAVKRTDRSADGDARPRGHPPR